MNHIPKIVANILKWFCYTPYPKPRSVYYEMCPGVAEHAFAFGEKMGMVRLVMVDGTFYGHYTKESVIDCEKEVTW